MAGSLVTKFKVISYIKIGGKIMKRKKPLKKIVLITAVMVVIGVAKLAVAGGIILVGPPPMPIPMPMPIMMPAPIPFPPPPPVFVVGPPTPVPMPVQPQPQVIIIRVIKQCDNPCNNNGTQVNNTVQPAPAPAPTPAPAPAPSPTPQDTGEIYNTYLAAPSTQLTNR